MPTPIRIPVGCGAVVTQPLPADFDPTGDTVQLVITANKFPAARVIATIAGTITGTAGAHVVTFVVPATAAATYGYFWARARIYPASGDPLQLFSRVLEVTLGEVTGPAPAPAVTIVDGIEDGGAPDDDGPIIDGGAP